MVAFVNGAAVQSQPIDAMGGKNFQKAWKFGGVLEADAGFYGERAFYGLAECCKERVELFRVAQESSASIFAADDGSGATEVEIDACDGVFLQLKRAANKTGNIGADQLGEDRFARLIFRDGSEQIGVEIRVRVDAEVFSNEPVGRTAPGDDPHERQVGDVLHRSKHQGRAVVRE